ncbi:hypothetical protein CR513_35254, partial [Mucuna pruriens]
MKAFPFSLDGVAKDWLYLQPVLFNTLGDMKCTFLEKFFPTSRTASIRVPLVHTIRSANNRSMIDATSGGALMDKTPAAARHLISNMASNTQQFGIRGPSQTRMNQLTELTSLVRQLAVGQHQPAMAAKVCGICTSVEHPTDMCPTLQETESDQTENVGAIGGFQYGKQPYQNRPFDSQQHGRQPFGQDRIKDHMQLNNSDPHRTPIRGKQPTPQYQAPPFQQQQQRVPTQGNPPSLEELMKQLTTSNLEFQQSMSSTLVEHDHNRPRPQNANWTASQYCESITVSRIQQPALLNHSKSERKRHGNELPQPTLQQLPRSDESDSEPNVNLQSRPEITVPLPFPSWTTSARKSELDEELLKMFRKVEINIPLLDAIKQVPEYAKFLRELCVHKRRKMKGSKEIGGVVSALTRNEEITTGASTLPKKMQRYWNLFCPMHHQ